MKKFLSFVLKLYLVAAGLIVAGIATLLTALFLPYDKIPQENLSKEPGALRRILDEANLHKCEIIEVTHGIRTLNTPFDKHLTAHAIKFDGMDKTNFDVEISHRNLWHRGDWLPTAIQCALPHLNTLKHRIAWLPSEAELKNKDTYFMLLGLRAEGDTATGVKLLIIRFDNKTIYHIDSQN